MARTVEAMTPSDAVIEPGYARAMLGIPLLEQIWRAVWENKWFVSAIMALCILVGVVVTMLATPLFTASALVEISRQQANVAGVEQLEEVDRTSDLEFYDTQYSLLTARSLAVRVSRAEGLASDPEFFEAFEEDFESAGEAEGRRLSRRDAQARDQRYERSIELLLDNIEINPVRGSSLVNVEYTSPQAALSARIANAWIEQYIEATLARRFSSTEDARDYLEEQLEQYRQQLEDSERRLVAYAADRGIVSLDELRDAAGNTQTRRTLAATNLEAMNVALAEARAARIEAQSQLARTADLQQPIVSPALNGLRQRRAEVAAERAQLLATFEPEYPTVQALTQQLSDLDGSIAAEEARVRRDEARVRNSRRLEIRQNFDAAVQRERALASEVAQLRGDLTGQNRDSIEYNIIQREVDTNRELYNSLLQRYKEIGVAGVSANNIAVVDRAEVPREPSSPSLILNLLLSVLSGLLLSAAFIFARTQIDQTLRDPDDVRRLLGLAPLGTIPVIESDELIDDITDPKSIAFEAYQSAGTNLSFLTAHGTPDSILFTSTQPNEGKTTSSFAIANVLARRGKKVALIDADMRNPSLHKIVGMENTAGLSTYLSGNDNTAQFLVPTKQSGLDLMPAGPIPPIPSELLASDRLGSLVALLGERYDHVVIDGPPVLGIADVPILAGNVEGVIFTLEANRTKLRAVQNVLSRLGHAHVYGAIITKVDQRNSAFGYGYGYGYSYGGSR